MSHPEQPPLVRIAILQRVAYLMLGSVTLTFTMNSYHSGIEKPPLLVLFASLLMVGFIAQATIRLP